MALANTESHARATVATMQQRQVAFATSVARDRRQDAESRAPSLAPMPGNPEVRTIIANRQKLSRPVTSPQTKFYTKVAGMFSRLLLVTEKVVVPRDKAMLSASYSQHPILKALREDTDKLQAMSLSENSAIQEAKKSSISRYRTHTRNNRKNRYYTRPVF